MFVRIEYPKIQGFDSNGNLAAGYEIWTYAAGGSTPVASYSDHGLVSANTNPVILNSRGEADVYTGVALKLVFTIPGGDPASPIWTVDYVGQQQLNNVTGEATPVTLHNNYVVDTVPPVLTLTKNFMLTMIPDVSNADTITSVDFTGTGINDVTAIGPYIGSTAGSVFTIQIDSNGTADTFKWKKDGGSWTTGVVITCLQQFLIENLSIIFAVLNGHTIGDIWAVTVETPARVNLDGTGNFLVYKNKGGYDVPLDGSDMLADYPAILVANDTADIWMLMNPATPIFSTTSISAKRYRKNITSAYDMVLGDEGYELSCIGSFTVTLLTCPEFSGRFVYFKNAGTGDITLDAGIYNIDYTGIHTMSLAPGQAAQLETNGVNWHVLTDVHPASGMLIFNSSGTFYVPYNVVTVRLIISGGGGGGGGAYADSTYGGGGGGASPYFEAVVTVPKNGSVAVTVGAGGAGGAASSDGSDGATSSFGAYAICTGGKGGKKGIVDAGGAGGAAGTPSGTGSPYLIPVHHGSSGSGTAGGNGGDNLNIGGAGSAAGNGIGGFGGSGGGGTKEAGLSHGGVGGDGFVVVIW
jgi:hypothetical protein